MPDLTEDQPKLIAAAAASVIEQAKRQIKELEERANLAGRTLSSYFDEAHLATRAKRLFVQDFAVEYPIRVTPGARVSLSLPGRLGTLPGSTLHLEQYESDGVLLPKGNYRAIVALVPRD